MSTRYGFIGAGRMACAMVRGWVKSKAILADAFYLTSKLGVSAQFLAQELGCHYCPSAKEVLRTSDVIFIAVKPQHWSVLKEQIKRDAIGKTLVSIMAGIPLKQLQEVEASLWVRVMPNTPVEVNAGVLAYCTQRGDTDDKVFPALSHLGTVVSITEDAFDHFTTVCGSGPAYYYFFLECFKEAALKLGMTPSMAESCVAQTWHGAAQLLHTKGLHLTKLKEDVVSAGGTTRAALDILENQGLPEHFYQALLAALQRAKELSNLNTQ